MEIKKRQMKKYNINPDVMAISNSNLQLYMSKLFNILTIYIIVIILLSFTNLKVYTFLNEFSKLNNQFFDLVGFFIGVLGLTICGYSQYKMGASWRVGIDQVEKTKLITTGFYRYIRNPTYLGLFILNLGLWTIWPMWSIFIFNIFFILLLEVQVRCEEDYLTEEHGFEYTEYKRRTKRYIPLIY